MKPKTLILMLVAVGCGLFAAFFAARYNATPPPVEVVSIIVAAKDLPAGTVLKEAELNTLLAIKPFPKDVKPLDALEGTPEEVAKLKGKALARSIGAGMPLTLKDTSQIDVLMKDVPKGHRAICLRGTAEDLGNGFIMPRNRVDLILSGADPKRPQFRKSWVFLQNVEVLAINGLMDPPPEMKSIANPTMAILCVNLADATKITTALTMGKVTLVLRKPGEDKTEPLAGDSPFDTGESGAAAAAAKTVKLLVAREKIEPGTVVEDVDKWFVAANFPTDLVSGAVTEEQKNTVKNLRVAHLIAKGLPVSRDQFVLLQQDRPTKDKIHHMTITVGDTTRVVAYVNGRRVDAGQPKEPTVLPGGVDVNPSRPAVEGGSEGPPPKGK